MELVSYSRDSVQVLALTGRFDAHSADAVRSWLLETTAVQNPTILVNLTRVHFIDSSALAALVSGLKRSSEKNGQLALCSLQNPVRIIFELTRLDRAFTIYDSEEVALEALQQAMSGV